MDKKIIAEYKEIVKRMEELEINKNELEAAKDLDAKVNNLSNKLQEAIKHKLEIETQIREYDEKIKQVKSEMSLEENLDKRKELFEKYKMIKKEKEYIETYNIDDIKAMVRSESHRISRSEEYIQVGKDFRRFSADMNKMLADLNKLQNDFVKEVNKLYHKHPYSRTPFVITGNMTEN